MRSTTLLHFLVVQLLLILISHTCESQNPSSESERIHSVLPRSTDDNFNIIMNQMKMLARVSNAVVLTQQLIAGNVQADVLFSELLKMGNVSVSQLKGLDTQKISDSANAMRDIPSKFNNDARVKKVEVAYQKQIEIGKELENITDYNTWPEKDNFTSTIANMRYSKFNSGKHGIIIWGVDSFFRYINSLKAYNGTIIKFGIEDIKISTVDLSSAIDDFPTSVDDPDFDDLKIIGFEKVATLSVVAEKYKSIDFTNLDETGFDQNVDNLPNAEKDVQTGLTELQIIGNILENQRKNPDLNSLIYTSGFQKGLVDLRFISSDLNNEWMSKVINSNSLETALKVLQQLHTPLNDATTKFETSGTEVITNEIDKALSLLTVNSDPIKIKADANAVKACDVKNKQLLVDISVLDKVEEFEENLIVKKEIIIKAGRKLKRKGVKHYLEELKTMCEEAEKKDRTELATDRSKILNYQHLEALKDALKHYETRTSTHDKEIDDDVVYILLNMSKIQTDLLDKLNDRKDVLDCLKQLKDKTLLHDAISTIQKIRKSKFPEFYSTLPLVEYIRSVTDEYEKFKRIVDGIKGKKTKETKGLSLLKDYSSIKAIGIAVQVIGRMNELVVRQLVEFELNTTMISTEMANVQLDAQDRINLNNLITLSPKFQTLKTELNQWKANVRNSNSTNLSDYKNLFAQSSTVHGISEDLRPMSKSLQVLIEKIQNRFHQDQLKRVKFTLDQLQSIGLDFARYSGSFVSASPALDILDTFFKKFSDEMADKKTSSTKKPSKERPYTSNYAPCGPCTLQTGINWPQWGSEFVLVSSTIMAIIIIIYHCTKM